MKEVTFLEIGNARSQLLKDKGYDEKTIAEFRSKIKKVSDEKAAELGQELFSAIYRSVETIEKDKTYIRNMILKGADVNEDKYMTGKAIHLLAQENLKNSFYWYILGGADINAISFKKQTPAMLAAEKGNLDILDDLILLKADLEIKDKEGNTAIGLALKARELQAAKKLVDANVILNRLNNAGQSLRDIGIQCCGEDNIKFLLESMSQTNESIFESESIIRMRQLCNEAQMKVEEINKKIALKR